MIRILHFIFFGLCISAAAVPRTEQYCWFLLRAYDASGIVGTVTESHTGMLFINGGFQQTDFYLEGDVMYDWGSRNLVFTNDQIFATSGRGDTGRISESSEGWLRHDGGDQLWWGCPGGLVVGNGFTLYKNSNADRTGCKPLWLKTDGKSCDAAGKRRSPVVLSEVSSALSESSTPSTPISLTPATCPTDISSSNLQFPHLIVPTSPDAPSTSFGNSFSATISASNTTLFNFDIPAAYNGICSLLFLFPFGSDLDPSAGKYIYSGMEQVIYQNGGLNFALLDGIATDRTTFSTTPAVAVDYGKTQILPGNKYTVATFPCQSGKRVTYQASSVNKTALSYFQNSGNQPIGLYIVPCA